MLHQLKASPGTVHWGYYDAAIRPVLAIRSGDSIRVETVHARLGDPSVIASLGLEKNEIPEGLTRICNEVKDRGPGGSILTGPVLVEGAEPEDVLEIEIKEIRLTFPFGYNAFNPGKGTLPEEYPYPRIKLIRLNLKDMTAEFSKEIRVPLRPFFGQLGVAPPLYRGRIDSSPPGSHGGNLDNKELVEGSKVLLPVHVRGGLFSVGDGHAGQGDGEVDGGALEACAAGTLQVSLRKGLNLMMPLAETPAHIISMGFHEDLDEAARMALTNMIDYLVKNKNLDRDEAYMLSSIAVDFHITQTVDGVKGVHGLLPKKIFQQNRQT